MTALRVLTGRLAGAEFALTEELVVGRSDADLDIDDPEISRRHVRLTPTAAGVEICDLSSANGTFVNGRRLDAPMSLTATTALRIGQTDLELVIEPSPDRATRISARPTGTAISEPGQAPIASTPAPDGRPAPAHTLQPFGAHTRPARRRSRRGPATRLLAPAAVTVLVILATAAALLIYFAGR